MCPTNKTSLFTATVLVILPTLLSAAETSPDNDSTAYNAMLIGLVTLMLVLLFAIGVLANTLRLLTLVIRDKTRKERSSASTMAKTTLLLLAFIVPATNIFGADTALTVSAASQTISGIPANDFYTIISVIIIELAVIFALAIYIKIFIKLIADKPELVKASAAITRKSWFWDKLIAAAPVEQEKDILLDHNYDGIQELDNSLPPWWKYGFYLTILVSFIYVYRFHISHSGASQQDEYIAEVQQGEEDKAAYLALSANNVDENTVTTLTDATAIAEGKEIFVKACAACHLADGGGTVGPNLTDEYWLHGGGIKNIFKSIKYGWQDKGMKSWKDDYSPKQIQELASFIAALKGTQPATPKAPQGELYIEASDKVADSATTASGIERKGKVAVK